MTYRVWQGSGWADADVPELEGEPLVLPGIGAVVYRDVDRSALLLQRRDKPNEPTRGLLEIPTGKWRAGEGAAAAVRREVKEETGLDVMHFLHDERRVEAHAGRPFVSVRPVTAVVGVEGAYPTLIVAFECVATGTLAGSPGDAVDPTWHAMEDVAALLQSPERFTGPSFAILSGLLPAT